MSSMSPDSWSFTYTAAVICMAETSTMPSRMPLFFNADSTCGVMWTYSRCLLELKVRYSVWNFMAVRDVCSVRSPELETRHCPSQILKDNSICGASVERWRCHVSTFQRVGSSARNVDCNFAIAGQLAAW